MNSRRLARLMEIICAIKARPKRTADEFAARFAVSRRQIYKDRDDLETLGFAFHHSRAEDGFVLDREFTFSARNLSSADFLALVLAIRSISELDDFSFIWGAINSLKQMADALPDPLRLALQGSLDDMIISEGYGCSTTVAYELRNAIDEQRLCAIFLEGEPDPRQVRPLGLSLQNGQLCLKIWDAAGENIDYMALNKVRRVSLTPFVF